MEREFYSQPLKKNVEERRSSLTYSQPVAQAAVENDYDTETSDNITPTPVKSKMLESKSSDEKAGTSEPLSPEMECSNENSASKLFNNYKSISDNLTTSLMEFRAEKITLENELSQLDRENEYLKLEIGRQKTHIENLNETSKNLTEKLKKEETETKKTVELKLLEVQEIFCSIATTDKFINDFKKTFSDSVTEAHEYCNDIKTTMKELKENSLKSSSAFKNEFDQYFHKFTQDLNQLGKSIAQTESKIERGLTSFKNHSLKKAQFDQELNDLLKEINEEQKKKDELENSLLYHSNLILEMKENQDAYMNNINIEICKLCDQVSQLTLKNSELDQEITSTERDLINLKEKCTQKTSEINSLRALEADKRNNEKIIQQEIESLENQVAVLQKDYKEALNQIELKKILKDDLKELEIEVFNLREKCRGLEDAKKKAIGADPAEQLLEQEEKLEQVKNYHQELLEDIESAQKQIEEKQATLYAVKKEGATLRAKMQNKVTALENSAEGAQDLDCIKNENEQLSSDIQLVNEDIEEKKKITSYLLELQLRQNEVYQNYMDELNNESGSSDDEESVDLLKKYEETLEAMRELEVTDLEERLKRVSAAVEFNLKQTEEALEIHMQDTEKLQTRHEQIIKDLEKDAENHKKYCDDMLAKVDSEMRYVHGKIVSIKDDVNVKRNEINLHIPKLAASIQTALYLFEKIVNYYSQACAQRQSGHSSIHWDNTKEVLQDILLHPLHKLSKLRGMPFTDTSSASPHIYLNVINQAQEMFKNITQNRNARSAEFICKKLMDMRNALYYQSDSSKAPISSNLNDTMYSSSAEG